ncbi:hypothetical protein [Geodermatophilus marinus]|uniref:hypothetical protein n=1 Tax=Geodermatophilus sp. LHW52908 TaxID=2303986 RepID=UPI000E3D55DC|nr:hypothetical protein [Geodermatophilus sp. LHW52908]RFU21318.1 hypothetical protein D0Z06_11070 [Geodermatophilus sp. LHW52908]
MGLLVFAVPALLVVVLGYVVGYALLDAFGAPAPVPEVVGWVAGLVLLVTVVRALVGRRGRLRWALRRARGQGDHPEVARLEAALAEQRRWPRRRRG